MKRITSCAEGCKCVIKLCYSSESGETLNSTQLNKHVCTWWFFNWFLSHNWAFSGAPVLTAACVSSVPLFFYWFHMSPVEPTSVVLTSTTAIMERHVLVVN